MKHLLVTLLFALLLPGVAGAALSDFCGPSTDLYLMETGGTRIDPATEGKQDSIITELQTARAVDSNNSSTTPLSDGATFTGTGTSALGYASAIVYVSTDQDSAAGGLSLETSTDNSNWDHGHIYTVTGGNSRGFEVSLEAEYFRVVYTNGGTIQSHFRLQTVLNKEPNSAHVHAVEYVIDGSHPASSL